MSDVSTINGKSIGDYDDYKNNIPEGGSASTFEQTAKIPLAGKYNVSDETMETRSVLLSELGGGGGLPSTSGNEGKFLTVNSSEEAVWGNAPKAVTAITAGAGMAVSGSGSVSVAINTSTANDGEFLKYDDGAITWGSINEVPSISGASNGDVLTVNNGAATWAAPGSGGGGDSNIAFLEFTVAYNSSDEEYHLTAASMTPQEIISAIESGKSVFARCARMLNNTIESVVQIPFSKYYNEDAYYPGSGNYNIWFGGPAGSGGADAPYFGISHMGGGLFWERSQWGVSDIDEQ